MSTTPDHFNAYVLRADGNTATASTESLTFGDLPEGEVVIEVEYTCANYKDMLAFDPRSKVVRDYPIVPGIDLAGRVIESHSSEFMAGDLVLAHGQQIGSGQHGGYAEYARVPAQWVVPLPQTLSTRTAMALGTAGFTAALSVAEILDAGIGPDDGPVLVTGASGGVGMISIDILAQQGFTVVASSGNEDAHELLLRIGAAEVINRVSDTENSPRPLTKATWSSVVDTIGGSTLSRVLSAVKYGGLVAASGNAGGIELSTTVLPFILRGVSLRGIDSVLVPRDRRRHIWQRLASDLAPQHLEDITPEHPLSDMATVIASIRQGQHTGRSVFRTTASFPQ